MAGEQKVPAIVLAGGNGQEPVAQALNLPHKALVPIGGELTVRRVLAARARWRASCW